ncbi:DUF1467 family protein [Microvirga sp. W0021]|uniref:DUF1467 family protein n=1 Tax=Hohaiivirga grylli TaxID=3133970 RepID=A0ABV0BIF6_9HYPH
MQLISKISANLWLAAGVVGSLTVAAIVFAVWVCRMHLLGAVAFYFVVWWITLFIALPIGIRSQIETGGTVTGTEPGAPNVPQIRERAVLTTLLADVIFMAAAIILPFAGL